MEIYRFVNPDYSYVHPCNSWVEDYNMYLSCPICGFSAKMDLITGEQKKITEGDIWAFHRGGSTEFLVEKHLISQN